MPTQEDIDAQVVLLRTYRKSLQIHLQKVAVFGTAHAPANIIHDISECRHNIHCIKSILRTWNVSVDDHPDDEVADLNQDNTALLWKSGKESSSISNEELRDRLDQGIILPSVGDIFVGRVLDMDQDLVLIEVPGFDPKVVPGVIRTHNLAKK